MLNILFGFNDFVVETIISIVNNNNKKIQFSCSLLKSQYSRDKCWVERNSYVMQKASSLERQCTNVQRLPLKFRTQQRSFEGEQGGWSSRELYFFSHRRPFFLSDPWAPAAGGSCFGDIPSFCKTNLNVLIKTLKLSPPN